MLLLFFKIPVLLALLVPVKAALLHITCLSSVSLWGKRQLLTEPWMEWTNWWTRSSAPCTDQATLWLWTMSCLQVESKQSASLLCFLKAVCGWTDYQLSICGLRLSTFTPKFHPCLCFLSQLSMPVSFHHHLTVSAQLTSKLCHLLCFLLSVPLQSSEISL